METSRYHTLYSSRSWQYRCTVTQQEPSIDPGRCPYVWCVNNVDTSHWSAVAVDIDQGVTEFRFKLPEDHALFVLIWL